MNITNDLTFLDSKTGTMKFLLSALTLTFTVSSLFSQNLSDSTQRKQLLFERFSDGAVLMKSGAVEKASLNYNTADQSVVFERNSEVLILTALETIDTIYFQNKKFVPKEKGIVYESLTNSGKGVGLYATFSSKLRPAVATTDQAGTTRKDAKDVNNTLSDIYVLRPYKKDFIVEIERHFWLIKGDRVYKTYSQKQFLKAFPGKADAIKKYLQAHPVNFKIEDEIIRLTSYCNTLG